MIQNRKASEFMVELGLQGCEMAQRLELLLHKHED